MIVNVHDTTVDRTAEGTGEVEKMTLAQVKALKLKADKFAGDFGCERIPTLEELLATCRGRAFVLVDANKTDQVEKMVDAIKKTDTLDWAIFDTSSLDKIDKALALEPKLMIMPRVEQLSDLDAIKTKYASHMPVLIEVSSKIFPQGANEIRAFGSRPLTDVFVTDVGIRAGDDRKAYLPFYDSGAVVLQGDLPDEILKAIGRPVPPP